MLAALGRRLSVPVGRALIGWSLAGWAAACTPGGSSAAARTRPAPLVAVAKVATRDVRVEARAPVDLRPMTQAEIGSKTVGYLEAVFVDRGDVVKKGQVLAIVRPSDLPDQLAAARGVVAQHEAAVALARSNLERAQTLVPNGLMSQADHQTAIASVASAEANKAAAQSNLQAVAVRLGETRLVSPIDGIVWQRKLDPGVLVGIFGASAVVSVVQVDTLRVFVPVNERLAPGVTVGKDAYVELDAFPGKTFTGKVTRMAPAYDSATRTLDAEVQLPNGDGLLRPGMYGRGAIVIEMHPQVPVVPVPAVQISNKANYVFVLVGDKAQRRPITLGVDGGDWLEVTSGLRDGEEVVTAGTDGLSDGATVRVSRDVPPAPTVSVAPTPSASTRTH